MEEKPDQPRHGLDRSARLRLHGCQPPSIRHPFFPSRLDRTLHVPLETSPGVVRFPSHLPVAPTRVGIQKVASTWRMLEVRLGAVKPNQLLW